MTSPPRNPHPRRADDEVVRTLASQALNDWLNKATRRFILWVIVSLVGTVAAGSWAASAWATNQSRDVADVRRQVDAVKAEEAATNEALREVTAQLGRTTTALDSLRITLQARGR